jgi:hypothetical protein
VVSRDFIRESMLQPTIRLENISLIAHSAPDQIVLDRWADLGVSCRASSCRTHSARRCSSRSATRSTQPSAHGVAGLFNEVAVAGLRVIVVGVEQSAGPMGLASSAAVTGLASQR